MMPSTIEDNIHWAVEVESFLRHADFKEEIEKIYGSPKDVIKSLTHTIETMQIAYRERYKMFGYLYHNIITKDGEKVFWVEDALVYTKRVSPGLEVRVFPKDVNSSDNDVIWRVWVELKRVRQAHIMVRARDKLWAGRVAKPHIQEEYKDIKEHIHSIFFEQITPMGRIA